MRKSILTLTLLCFVLGSINPVYAQGPAVPASLIFPKPGTMIDLSPAFEPLLIKGLTVHKDNPFMFDFVIDSGHNYTDLKKDYTDVRLREDADRLIKYFFACLAIPEKDLWVNLSPFEKDRIAPEALGQTALGRDLLAEDYILKQLTASLIYPEKDFGREFWDKVYTKAQALYGTTEIPVNTFNKVWILADQATVYEHGQTAFVVSGHLKVMLESDYLATQKNAAVGAGFPGPMAQGGGTPPLRNELGSQIIRELIIPELEREVNEGKNFATLRQIFNSMILASWYKKNLKQALLNQVFADQSKIKGVDLADPAVKEEIYQQYLTAYKKGVFNYIKEEPNAKGERVPRKYFSGGFGSKIDQALVVSRDPADANRLSTASGNSLKVTVAVGINQPPVIKDKAMTTMAPRADILIQQEHKDANSIKVNGQWIRRVGDGSNVNVYGPVLLDGKRAALRIYKFVLSDERRDSMLAAFRLGHENKASPGVIGHGVTGGSLATTWIAVDWTDAVNLKKTFDIRRHRAGNLSDVWSEQEKKAIKSFLTSLRQRGLWLIDNSPLNLGIEQKQDNVLIQVIDAEAFVRESKEGLGRFMHLYNLLREDWQAIGLMDVFDEVYADMRSGTYDGAMTSQEIIIQSILDGLSSMPEKGQGFGRLIRFVDEVRKERDKLGDFYERVYRLLLFLANPQAPYDTFSGEPFLTGQLGPRGHQNFFAGRQLSDFLFLPYVDINFPAFLMRVAEIRDKPDWKPVVDAFRVALFPDSAADYAMLSKAREIFIKNVIDFGIGTTLISVGTAINLVRLYLQDTPASGWAFAPLGVIPLYLLMRKWTWAQVSLEFRGSFSAYHQQRYDDPQKAASATRQAEAEFRKQVLRMAQMSMSSAITIPENDYTYDIRNLLTSEMKRAMAQEGLTIGPTFFTLQEEAFATLRTRYYDGPPKDSAMTAARDKIYKALQPVLERFFTRNISPVDLFNQFMRIKDDPVSISGSPWFKDIRRILDREGLLTSIRLTQLSTEFRKITAWEDNVRNWTAAMLRFQAARRELRSVPRDHVYVISREHELAVSEVAALRHLKFPMDLKGVAPDLLSRQEHALIIPLLKQASESSSVGVQNAARQSASSLQALWPENPQLAGLNGALTKAAADQAMNAVSAFQKVLFLDRLAKSEVGRSKDTFYLDVPPDAFEDLTGEQQDLKTKLFKDLRLGGMSLSTRFQFILDEKSAKSTDIQKQIQLLRDSFKEWVSRQKKETLHLAIPVRELESKMGLVIIYYPNDQAEIYRGTLESVQDKGSSYEFRFAGKKNPLVISKERELYCLHEDYDYLQQALYTVLSKLSGDEYNLDDAMHELGMQNIPAGFDEVAIGYPMKLYAMLSDPKMTNPVGILRDKAGHVTFLQLNKDKIVRHSLDGPFRLLLAALQEPTFGQTRVFAVLLGMDYPVVFDVQNSPDEAMTAGLPALAVKKTGLDLQRAGKGKDVGGIALDSVRMDMTVTKDAQGGVQVDFDPAMIEMIRKQGIQSIAPIIINITPLLDTRPLLGLTPQKGKSDQIALL